MAKETASETMVVPRDEHGESIRAELWRTTGINPARCYQCGKCSAGCPMAEEMGTGPQQLLRLVQLNERAKVLSNEAIWLCLTCETCSTRCPNDVRPARLIDGLRELAARESPEHIPRKIRAFHRSFLEQIRTHGRVFEFGLVVSYKLRSGDYFGDMATAPGMFARGKLKLAPHRIKGRRAVERLVDTCLKDQEHYE